MPLREAQGRPPGLTNLNAQGTTVLEQIPLSINRSIPCVSDAEPIIDEGVRVRACPETWPSPGKSRQYTPSVKPSRQYASVRAHPRFGRAGQWRGSLYAIGLDK